MKAKLSEGLIDQIRKTVIVQDKHLLISDADEVLLNFLPCFENYLQNNSMWYDLKSYALFGNIKIRFRMRQYLMKMFCFT